MRGRDEAKLDRSPAAGGREAAWQRGGRAALLSRHACDSPVARSSIARLHSPPSKELRLAIHPFCDCFSAVSRTNPLCATAEPPSSQSEITRMPVKSFTASNGAIKECFMIGAPGACAGSLRQKPAPEARARSLSQKPAAEDWARSLYQRNSKQIPTKIQSNYT